MRKLEDWAQLFLEEVPSVERAVGTGDVGKLGLLTGREVLGVLPKGEASALEVGGDGLLTVAAGGVPDLAAQLIQGVGRPGDDVERVHAEFGVGAVLLDGVGDPGAGVGADQPDLCAALRTEQVEELGEGWLVATRGGPEQPTAVMIDDDRQVSLTPAITGLVDADAPQALEGIGPLAGGRGDAAAATRRLHSRTFAHS